MRLRIGARLFEGPGPFLMGVVNATPDSFSDGGRLLAGGAPDLDRILRRAQRMCRDGAALLEQSIVGGDGQPRSTTFLDYLLPVSSSMPDITIVHTETPSPFTPGGMKGMGEGGTNGGFGSGGTC